MAAEVQTDGGVVIDLRDGATTAAPTATAAASTAPVAAPVAPAAPAVPDERTHRTLRLVALGLLVVLNALDILSTEAFLRAGVEEGNPLAVAAVEGGWMIYVKAALLIGLGYRFVRRPPTLGSTCVVWCVVGIYCTVVYVNLLVLRTVGGSLF